MKNVIRVLVLLLCIAAVGAVMAWRLGWRPTTPPAPSSSPSSPPTASPPPTVSVSPSPSPLPTRDRTILRVAVSERASSFALEALPGYLRDARSTVNVECITVPNAADRWQMLAAGRVDIACGTLDSFVLAAHRRDPGAIIFKLASSVGYDALVARDVKSLEGLTGKRVAVVSDEGGEYMLNDFLRDRASSQVTIHRAEDVDDAYALLESGRVQAACLWEPYVEKARAAGMRALASSSTERPMLEEVCVANGGVLRDRRDEVVEFIRGWFRLEGLLSRDPRTGRQILAKDGPRKIGELGALDRIHFYSLADNQKLDTQSLVNLMEYMHNAWRAADVPNTDTRPELEAAVRTDLVRDIEIEGSSSASSPSPRNPSPEASTPSPEGSSPSAAASESPWPEESESP